MLNRGIFVEEDKDAKAKKKSQRHRRQNKKLVKPKHVYLPMIFQLLGFTIVIFAYFLGLYIVSNDFIDLSDIFMGDVAKLSDKTPDHYFLLYALAEIIYAKYSDTLGEAKLLGQPFETQYDTVAGTLFNKEEKFLLSMIEDNSYLSQDARNQIDDLMFGNLCTTLDLSAEMEQTCLTTADDVLSHGLHPRWNKLVRPLLMMF